MTLSVRCPLACSLLRLAAAPAAADPKTDDLAAKAQAVLKAHCQRCHGQPGTAKGGLFYILDRDTLVARKKVVPDRPDESELYRRIAKGEMPPASVKARPSKDDVLALRRWI